ncbi:MAG: GNAT family N-acetyltransferase [Planctomycetales bacterium]|jgi:ribosomal protein S18 acetylase RimI-like enzyme
MPQDNVTLRTESDNAGDRAFIRQLFDTLDHIQHLRELGPSAEMMIQMQLDMREKQYRERFPNASFQLILLDGRPAGRIVADRTDGQWHLVDIVVLPECCGSGIGTQVVGDLLQAADKLDQAVSASVFSNNTNALRLWLRLGFAVSREELDYTWLRFEPSGKPAC